MKGKRKRKVGKRKKRAARREKKKAKKKARKKARRARRARKAARRANRMATAATSPKKSRRRRKKRKSQTTASTATAGRITTVGKKKNKGGGSKKGVPSWVRPLFSMILGGGVGLVVSGLLPPSVGPYAPAVGILAAKFVGGGSWTKYATTAGVVTGVMFLSNRKTIQAATGALTAARQALVPGSSGGGGDAAAQGADILKRRVGG